MYIGIDDTDSDKGMCTTYLALEIIKEFEGDLDLIGHPRLVRLNPNIPWKTRGNGAICVRMGKGSGRKRGIGEVDGRIVNMWPDGTTGDLAPKAILKRATQVLERHSHLDAKGTNSAIVVTRTKPSPALYWMAVREVVPIKVARTFVPKGSAVKAYKSGRGLIGATAAISWRPRDRTYEAIAYREPDRWGSKRKVDPDDVKALDKRFPSTFNNYDLRNKHMAIVPASPCPVLMGIRGDDPRVLPKTLSTVGSEPKDRWIVFKTNQGTDDHMVPRKRFERYQSGIVTGKVIEQPTQIKGGHIFFRFISSRGRDRVTFTCAAYEPTKEFRNMVRDLRPGDRLTIFGSRGAAHPDTVSIEKMRVDHLVKVRTKVGNPKCPGCGRSMKSIGREQGFRCRRCGTKASEADARTRSEKRAIRRGFHEVPICARRHLSRPLKRKRMAKPRPQYL